MSDRKRILKYCTHLYPLIQMNLWGLGLKRRETAVWKPRAEIKAQALFLLLYGFSQLMGCFSWKERKVKDTK